MAFTKTAGVEYGTPAVVLSSTAAAGSNQTAIRTDGQLIAFNADTPEDVTTGAAAAGSVAFASRIDHVHSAAGADGDVVGPSSSVADSIPRYSGTGGKTIKGYTSQSPTFSDDGILTIPSGQITFPSTQVASSDPNTLDMYEEGTWTPVLQDYSTSTDATYGTNGQVASYTRIGNRCFYQCYLQLASTGTLTTADQAHVAGLPFTTKNVTNGRSGGAIGALAGLSLGSNSVVMADLRENSTRFGLEKFDLTTNNSVVTIGQFTNGGRVTITGNFEIN